MTDKDIVPAPPAGFVRSGSRGPFSSHNGPYFHRAEMGEVTEQAFYALPRHANGLGLVHGGMLTAFLDGLMGAAVTTTVWYLLDNPYGIDNMYIALLTPAVVIVLEKLLFGGKSQAQPAEKLPEANGKEG